MLSTFAYEQLDFRLELTKGKKAYDYFWNHAYNGQVIFVTDRIVLDNFRLSWTIFGDVCLQAGYFELFKKSAFLFFRLDSWRVNYGEL